MKRSLFALACLVLAGGASAQSPYPSRPIRIIVPFPAGSTAFTETRAYADLLGKELGVEVYLEPKPGAQGAIGAMQALQSPPDGYTVGLMTRVMLTLNLFDPTKFVYSTLMSQSELFLVVPEESNIKTLAQLIASDPSNYAAVSPGAQETGLKFAKVTGVHAVAVTGYSRGEASALLDLHAGRVQYAFFFGTTSITGVQNGWLRPLASISTTRSKFLPDVPSIVEALTSAGKPTYQPIPPFMGAVFPPGTPMEVAERFSQAICKASKDPVLLEQFKKIWSNAVCSSPQEFKALAERVLSLQ